MGISINNIKFINSLKQKKVRNELGLFIAEGEKIAEEILKSSANINSVYATELWISENSNKISDKKIEVIEVKQSELERISSLTTPNEVLVIAEKFNTTFDEIDITQKLSLGLDDIKDPGNLGTIIRIADWFGIENIFCSENTVELYNSKVIQATMGSFLRVNVHYLNLNDFISKIKSMTNIYATTLDGQDIYKQNLENKGVILIGNESNGISKNIINQATHKLFIQNFSINKNEKAESLNASIATAIICSEFRRNF